METYLSAIIPELSRAGHQIAFLAETDGPVECRQISLPDDSGSWSLAALGEAAALTALNNWRPDVIYAHKVLDPDLEKRILNLAPSVFFAHDYSGTCISGDKTFKSPVVQPCSRKFGKQCLLHYFPHRCGGLNPITMFKLYSLQSQRLRNMRCYDAVVTHSDHMLAELTKHGLLPQRGYKFPISEKAPDRFTSSLAAASSMPLSEGHERREGSARSDLHLLFCGRMEYLKGAHLFIAALPLVAAALARPIHITFAGDGRERQNLERQAAALQNQNLVFDFAGWIDHGRLEEILGTCDLLVVPSLWPEPFGLVGPEAGQHGVPVAAFDVGGISDWLSEGVNGFLAAGDPPTSDGLAQAIINCLKDPATHLRLRNGAVAVAQQFNVKNHLTALMEVFESVVRRD
ncbi:MAG TPA: glycosyltransferase family 4 protein [Pyrinomonadaceae bacterium]|nr:glycosyltransferase family 4 protein [Pyrinomonadaceae bacterium]